MFRTSRLSRLVLVLRRFPTLSLVDGCLACDLMTGRTPLPVCLWSHAGGTSGHIHYVVKPVTRELMDEHRTYGPRLQVAMFDAAEAPPEGEVVAFADRARVAF
jgi:hypothetical protein